MKLSKLMVFLISAALLMSGCSQDTGSKTDNTKSSLTKTDKYGGTFTTDAASITTLNFIDYDSSDQANILNMIADCLFSFDENLNVVPRLAKSWELEDNRILTVNLRDDVYFHDGERFTADDVICTYNLSITEQMPWGNYASTFEDVKEVKKLDDFTLRIEYKKRVQDPFIPFLDFFIMPEHLYGNSEFPFLENPANFNPVGTGPFKLEKWEKEVQVSLIYNENYFAGRPYLDRLVFKFIDKSAMRFQMLLNHELDLIPISSVQWKFKTSSPEFKNNFDKYKYFIIAFYYTLWNNNNQFFKYKEVRQAMAYAADLHGYNKTVLFNLYKVATSPVHPDGKYYNNSIKSYPLDLKKAQNLLTQLNIIDRDNDGILEDSNGKPFEFEYLIPSYNASFQNFAEAFQANLKKIGVKMNIRIIDPAIFAEKVKTRDFDAYFSGMSTIRDPQFIENIFSERYLSTENVSGYTNPELEQLLSQASNEFNHEKRQQYFYRIQEILNEDQPFLFMYYPPALVAADKKLKNIKPSAVGMFQWYPGLSRVYIEN